MLLPRVAGVLRLRRAPDLAISANRKAHSSGPGRGNLCEPALRPLRFLPAGYRPSRPRRADGGARLDRAGVYLWRRIGTSARAAVNGREFARQSFPIRRDDGSHGAAGFTFFRRSERTATSRRTRLRESSGERAAFGERPRKTGRTDSHHAADA